MSTLIRPEVSKSNLYFIPKHRFYELKHFCLQYPMWRKMVAEIDGYKSSYEYVKIPGGEFWKSNVEDTAELRDILFKKIDMVDACIWRTDPEIANWLHMGVTGGISYTTLSIKYDLPCSKDMYYDRFRKFFWLLDKIRG